jgi:hypothetical protein
MGFEALIALPHLDCFATLAMGLLLMPDFVRVQDEKSEDLQDTRFAARRARKISFSQ